MICAWHILFNKLYYNDFITLFKHAEVAATSENLVYLPHQNWCGQPCETWSRLITFCHAGYYSQFVSISQKSSNEWWMNCWGGFKKKKKNHKSRNQTLFCLLLVPVSSGERNLNEHCNWQLTKINSQMTLPSSRSCKH